MPDQEVLINDSNLNAIANAIRRKNGLVRTYKPREMAPAIRSINADAPDSREYTVTVIQTPHQHITVRQILGGEKQYDQSFTVSEPYWKIQATIEADAGYVAGGLNYPNEVTVDRDITIKATPATEIEVPPDEFKQVYLVGQSNYNQGLQHCYISETPISPYNEYTTPLYPTFCPDRRYSILVTCPLEQIPWDLYRLFNVFSPTYSNAIVGNRLATDIVINFENKRGLQKLRTVIGGYEWVENIDLTGWDTSQVVEISNLLSGYFPRLKSFIGVSYWDTQCLKSIDVVAQASEYMDSLDLSNWTTPILTSATNIFSGGRILDISNWDTTNISSFSAGISAKTKVGVLYPAYLIMDKEEVKFSGNYIFGNIANCKYLVPEDMVDAYKQHPNWASRASQIESITNYTINRANGQITVVPNW